MGWIWFKWDDGWSFFPTMKEKIVYEKIRKLWEDNTHIFWTKNNDACDGCSSREQLINAAKMTKIINAFD